MSDQKLKGGLMIIGSLYWDNDPFRLELREKFLDMDSTKTVDAPIRYGRSSQKRETYTMVFSSGLSSDEQGKTKLVSLKEEYCTTEKIEEANKAIINAEHKKETHLGRYNWGWGCLSVLLNPKFNDQKISDLWDRNFGNGFDPSQYMVGKEQPVVKSNGQLQIPWLDSYNDYDFIIVTATKPEIEKYPNADELTGIFKKNDEYFIGNYETGIRTFQDDKIIKPLMDSKGFKKTKAGWIPKDWAITKLGKHSTKVGSGSTPRGGDKVYTENGTPFLRSQNVNDNKLILKGVKYIPKHINDKMKGTLVKRHDVLLNITGASIGRSCVVPDNFEIGNVNQHVCIVRLKKDELNPEFVQGFLSTYQGQKTIFRSQLGGNREGLNHQGVRGIDVPQPKLPEQKAIAKILSTWDKAIENLTQLIFEKQQKKKALMQQLLTRKKRFPGYDGEWKELKLGEYFTERKESKIEDLPLLSIGSSGVYPQTESNKKDTSNTDKAKYKRICPDDIGYNTMRMWQGRSALSSLEGIVSPAYTIVTPKENADVLFFSYLFKFPYVVHRFFRNSQGLVDDTLNCKFKDFAIVKVMVPPTKEEQTKIAQVLKNADAEIKVLEKKKDHLQDQKKGLMQQLLTGKKRLEI